MTTRKYTSRSQQTTLTSAVTSGATVIPVTSATTLLGGATISAGQTFTVVIDPDTALEEIVDVTSVSSNNLTVTRAIDGSSAQDHSAGAVIRHMIIGRDLREANTHIETSVGVHGIGATSYVVGTLDAQTLTNKTLTSPTITNPNITGAGVDASIVFEGTTADAYETTLTVVDPTQDNTVTIPNTSGTVTINDATQTLTNKTLTSPTISGSPVITGLSSAGMVASSATPKDYVDAILGSATAASTSAASAATSASSAATSASAAATSASSAAASATAAATSASSASTQATNASNSASAAATSATSAAASATAAATSATSAAASATAAATSATSAAASATTSSNSAAAAATSATSAAASATAAATSATSAAASATAAATSATNASASSSAAATSATSAAASATAAATSATSAAASATAAATSATSAAASATTASNSAAAAATSATSAAASATAAATSATSAAASATAAASSAADALTSANSAATSYDNFDDRYLGAKSSDPTLDNDGNALLTGALYFNTVVPAMKVYTGSAWQIVAPDTSNFVDKALWTAKGTLISASGASTPLALTVASTNGYILSVDSSTTSGLAWAAPNPGDITAVTASSPLTGGGTSGDVTVGIQDASTTQKGAVQLTDSTSSTSTTTAATPNSVKSAYDLANAAVPKSLADAKGDIFVASANDTVARLGVGTDGYLLTASSTATNGVTWAAAPVSLPTQTGNGGKLLTTDGTTASWAGAAPAAQTAEPSTLIDGLIWVDTDGTAPTTVVTRWQKSGLAEGTTSLSGNDDNSLPLSYTPGYEQVFLNGALLSRANDYTATSGTSITLTTGVVTGDIVEVICATQVAYADTYTQTQANATFLPNTNNFTAGKNKIINGDFRINQRAFTSTTTDSTYGLDRWFLGKAGDGTTTYSVETFTPGTAPVAGYEAINYARIVTTGQTQAGVYSILSQRIEDVRTLAGQTVTVSFWAKAASGTPNITVELAQNYGSGGTGTSDLYKSKIAITTSWARYSVTLALNSIASKTIGTSSQVGLGFWVSAGSNFNSRVDSLGIQTNTFDFWGVQVEAGSNATAFQTATGTLQGELAACQRYYIRYQGGDAYIPIANGSAGSTTNVYANIYLPVEMRVKPSSIEYSNIEASDGAASVTGGTLTMVTGSISQKAVTLQYAKTTSFTQYRPYLIQGSNNTGAYVGFNAEL